MRSRRPPAAETVLVSALAPVKGDFMASLAAQYSYSCAITTAAAVDGVLAKRVSIKFHPYGQQVFRQGSCRCFVGSLEASKGVRRARNDRGKSAYSTGPGGYMPWEVTVSGSRNHPLELETRNRGGNRKASGNRLDVQVMVRLLTPYLASSTDRCPAEVTDFLAGFG